MKKIIAMIGAFSLMVVPTMSLVSCTTNKTTTINAKHELTYLNYHQAISYSLSELYEEQEQLYVLGEQLGEYNDMLLEITTKTVDEISELFGFYFDYIVKHLQFVAILYQRQIFEIEKINDDEFVSAPITTVQQLSQLVSAAETWQYVIDTNFKEAFYALSEINEEVVFSKAVVDDFNDVKNYFSNLFNFG